MMISSTNLMRDLSPAFESHGIEPNDKSDYLSITITKDRTKEKILRIVQDASFCPLLPVSYGIEDRTFDFTVVPYRLPYCFTHLRLAEITQLLEAHKYQEGEAAIDTEDRWPGVNYCRRLTASSLNKGLSDLLFPRIKNGHPIVEIGSGPGYTLNAELSSKTIRIQPHPTECYLLSHSSSSSIYQMDVETFHQTLRVYGKKIPLIFALNTFDAMSLADRKHNLARISELQDSGDSLFILLDTNPCLDQVIEELKLLYPECSVLPYFSNSSPSEKLSLILIPKDYISDECSALELAALIQDERLSLKAGVTSTIQSQLHLLKEAFNLTVIALEDFYAERVKAELEEARYRSRIYYHTSFDVADVPIGFSDMAQDLTYKAVTDTITERGWALNDENLIRVLAEKGIKLPDTFTESYIAHLRASGKKVFGAEILVIQATKV